MPPEAHAPADPQARILQPPPNYSLRRSLSDQRMGRGDPTLRLSSNVLEIAAYTAGGPASLRAEVRNRGVHVRGWGPGAECLSAQAHDLLGFADPAAGFRPPEGPVRRLWRRAPGLRLGRFPSVYVRTVQAVLQQLITTKEGLRSWRRLTLTLGTPAPGPLGLHLPPRAEAISDAPGYVFSACGIVEKRARTLKRVARAADRLERAGSEGWAALEPELLRLPGVGPWTAEYVRGSALADPDAVMVGDYGLPHAVAWVLAGEPRATDQRMLELLEPFRGNRYRVIRLLHTSGGNAPRRGHRRPIRQW